MEGGKPKNLEKNNRSKDENQQQTQPTYDAGPESNPSALTTAPTLLCKFQISSNYGVLQSWTKWMKN